MTRRRSTGMTRIKGQSSVEYLIITVLIVIVLINGSPSPLQQVFDAFKSAYQKFTYAMSTV